jgi:hypothetical protein
MDRNGVACLARVIGRCNETFDSSDDSSVDPPDHTLDDARFVQARPRAYADVEARLVRGIRPRRLDRSE